MTKGAIVALAILLLAPLAHAHGSPQARGIDTRVLTDNTQGGDYGEIGLQVTNVPNPLAANAAVDLLNVDVREAYGPAGDAGVWMRIVFQGGGEGSHRIELSFDIGGQTVSRFFESDDLNQWTGDADHIVAEVIPVGDGHPKALEFFLSSDSIGEGTLSNMALTSKLGGGTGDIAPGTYQTLAGLEAVIPGADGTSTDYAMVGPAELLTLSGRGGIDLEQEESFELTIENLVDEAQFVSFQTQAGFGGNIGISPDSVALGPGETATVTVIPTAPVRGVGSILAITDLGGRAAWVFAYNTETVPLADTDGEFGFEELLPPGAAYEFTFDTAGNEPYHCHPHPFMVGTVVVQEGANPAGPTTHNVFIFDNGLESTEDEMGFLDEMSQTTVTTIYEGDTVRWTNTGTHPDYHNVNPGSHEDGVPHHHGPHDESEPTPAPFAILLVALAFLRRRA